jgi:hypothetical protein
MTVADYKISSPHLQVLRGSLDAPEVMDIQTLNPDLIAWDMTRAKHRWPEVKDAPFLWLTFISWHAARREGRIPADLTYDQWQASTLDVSNMGGEDDADEQAVNPSHGAAAPD